MYYSSAANDIFKVENDNSTVQSIPINRIITEKEYAASQMEYYVFLTWVNQQKFKWMFKRHLLQQNKTLVHLGLIILLIYFVYQLIQLLTD